MDIFLPLRFRRLRPFAAAALFILLSVTGRAQVATVRESLQVFRTYPFSDPDPVARPGNIYPYFRFQGYSSRPVERPWHIVVLENAYIRVLVAPELGGKILGAFEKSTGRAFIYYNRVIKFREIAMRGPWTSGGIEFNFGDIGHAPTTATPVDYLTRTNPDGSASCFVGALDLASGTEWRVEIRVPAGRALFETRSSWRNPTETSTSLYHWMNAAAAADSSLELVYPGKAYIGHGGELSPWPGGPGGRDLSRYRDNGFGSYKSYHVLGGYTDFFGARWGDFGVIHWSRYADKPGKKLWIWGLSREGEIWTDLLTDPPLGNTQYVEFQSGLHFNQAFGRSSMTPFKHMQFLPGSSERFTESWFPFTGVRSVTRATPEGVLEVRRGNGGVAYAFCPTGEFRGSVSIRFQGGTARTHDVSLRPLQCTGDSAASPGEGTHFEIRIGSIIRYTSEDDSERVLSRPLAPSRAFDWTSPYGLSVGAAEQSRQRDYDGALVSYRQSLAKDPAFVPSLSGASELLYRRTEYDSAFAYARRALAVDAYDPRANYMYGLAARKLGRRYDARDGFGIAAMSREYRSAADMQMAELAFAEGEWSEAAEFGARVLADDGAGGGAGRLMAALYRRTGDTASALRVLETMTAEDPLSHFAGFERYLLSRSAAAERAFTAAVRNELPQETFMEIAAFYGNLGAWDDALEALRLSPPHPMVDLWRAYAASRLERKAESGSLLAQALLASPYLVFPHRREEMDVLLWAERERPDWKTKYYLGLLCMGLGKKDEASHWLENCGDTPDFAPFYLTRASLSYGDSARALADYRRARIVGPAQWRTHNALISCLNERGLYADALPLSEAAAAKFPGSYILNFLLARTLLFNGKYAGALSILDTLHILPFEGARYGRDAYRQACIMTALAGAREGRGRGADSLIARARLWPERLGAGEPYGSDTRVEDYIDAGLRKKTGGEERRNALLANIAAYTTARPNAGNIQDLIGAFALRALGRTSEALRILTEWKAKDPANPEARWALMIFRGESQSARALEESLRPTLLNRSTGDQDFVLVRDVVRSDAGR